MKLTVLLLSLFSFSFNAHAFGRHRGQVALDPVTPSSILSGDATALAEGCGQQPSPLGMFCRLVEGEVAPKSIFLIAPPALCDREVCAFVKVWNNQGVLVFGDSIPKGKTRIEVPWKTLLGRETVAKDDHGTWAFNTTVYFKGTDGLERVSVAQGDIVLRVFQAGYVPLAEVQNDPAFVWTWADNGFLYRVTSGLRAFVGKAP